MEDILKTKLYEYLDSYCFVNYDEVLACVDDFFMKQCEEMNPEAEFYQDTLEYYLAYDYAIEYIIARWLEFESDVVNWEDLNHVEDWKQSILDYKKAKWVQQ